MKKIINFLRGFMIAPFILYIFNKMAVSINMYIPLNIVNIVIVGLLGIPGLIMLIIIKLLIF